MVLYICIKKDQFANSLAKIFYFVQIFNPMLLFYIKLYNKNAGRVTSLHERKSNLFFT